MTNEQILTKALRKAIKNGFDMGEEYLDRIKEEKEYEIHCPEFYWWIFDHGFAKALGYKLKDLGAWCDDGKESLKYIEKFL